MSPARALSALALVLAGVTAPVTAQLAPVTVPKGLLRLDFGGKFESWDHRFVNGVKQDAALDFRFPSVDAGVLPALAADQARLRRVTGVQAITLSLGATASAMLVNLGTGGIGAAYGVTRRITLFGTVPIVRVRVQNRFDLDSTEATAAFNPADPTFGDAPGKAQTAGFLSGFQTALAQLSSRLAAGDFDADPAQKTLAQQTLARGTALRADLKGLLDSATFLPRAGSAAAGTITAPIESLRSTLAGLGVTTLSGLPALPVAALSGTTFGDYFTNVAGPFQAKPFAVPVLQYIGDIEVGAAYTWLDRRPVGNGLALRSVLVGTVRLRTGQLDQPASFFDVGTGDRQPDVQADLVTDIARGRFGARLTARYVLQLSGRQERRLTPPDRPLAPAATLAAVEWNPGEIAEGSIEPFVRIAPTLSLNAGVRYRSKGADKYVLVKNQAPIEGVSPDALAIGSRQTVTAFSAGLTFSHSGIRADGSPGLPMDAFLRWEMVTGSSTGRVPASETVSVVLRLYRKMF